MHRKFVLIFCLVAYSISSLGQILTQNQKQTVGKQIDKFLDSYTGAKYEFTSSGDKSFCVINQDTFFNPNGFHYIYQLKNGEAIRKDHSPYQGHNFRRNLVVYKNDIYLLGGYGFFVTNNTLEKFSFKTQEWDFVPTSGDKPPFIRGAYLQKDDVIYCFNNKKSGNNMEPDIYDEHIYKLDLSTRNWTKYENINDDLKNIKDPTEIYLKDYSVIIYSGYCIIFNNHSLDYIKISNDELNLTYVNIRDKEIEVSGNEFTCTYSGAVANEFLKITNDADKLWKKHLADIQHPVLEPNLFQSNGLFFIILAIVFILSIFIWVFKLYRIIIPETPVDSISPIINKFIQSGKSKVSLEELDEFFGISHMETESKKSKRHRMLKNIEQKHAGFISREKDEVDRRKFSYIIDFQALKQKK